VTVSGTVKRAFPVSNFSIELMTPYDKPEDIFAIAEDEEERETRR
jgi:hypothetical protein